MERYITIVDYHQRKNNDHILYDKQATNLPKCTYPWTKLVVNQYGAAYNCLSPAWLPKSIGSLLDHNDFFDLLNTHEARAIRSEIDLHRYSYCNSKICQHLSGNYARGHFNTTPIETVLLTEEQFTPTSTVSKLPNEICFDFDYTCNFKCPSCRTEMINHNQGPMADVNQRLVDKIKHVILDRYIETNTPLTIRWAGGEPFVSHAYLELWQYIVDKKAVNIKSVVQTNGSYLHRRAELLEAFLPYVSQLRISFDAATAETYTKVRVNGDWLTLISNCNYIKTLIDKSKLKVQLSSDFVVQLDNFQEIPQYIELAKSFKFNLIYLSKMWSWGTWSDEEFTRLNVSDTNHPRHQELVDIVKPYQPDKTIVQDACKT